MTPVGTAAQPPAPSPRSAEQLEASLSRMAREVQIIQVIASDVISTLDLGDILKRILASMENVLGFRHSMILLLDEAGQTLRVVASRGFDESGVGAQIPLGQGIIGTVAQRQRMMRMSHIGYHRSYLAAVKSRMAESGMPGAGADSIELPGLAEVQSQIAIPLMVKDRLTGVLSVESPVPNAFDELDETLLKILGNQAAAAIDNARLYGVAEERLAELDRVNAQLARLNESLEEEVRRRTAELQAALVELQETQDQLIVREKMASLGHLVAGLTHEINTPVGVVTSSGDVVHRCVERLEADIGGAGEGTARTLSALRDSVRSLRAAGERIATLVKSLKTFAHLDEAEVERVDLRLGLKSAVTLLRPELSERIAVEEEYGQIPEVLCSPGQINQVFMSLLLNAVQAIDGRGTIGVRTSAAGDRVRVEVSDSGRGIPPERLDGLFDFALRRDGRRVRMGVGLAISHGIVKKHGGDIEVESLPGKGSRFTVVLPVSGPGTPGSTRA